MLVRKEGSGGEVWGTEKSPSIWVAVGLSKALVQSQQARLGVGADVVRL